MLFQGRGHACKQAMSWSRILIWHWRYLSFVVWDKLQIVCVVGAIEAKRLAKVKVPVVGLLETTLCAALTKIFYFCILSPHSTQKTLQSRDVAESQPKGVFFDFAKEKGEKNKKKKKKRHFLQPCRSTGSYVANYFYFFSRGARSSPSVFNVRQSRHGRVGIPRPTQRLGRQIATVRRKQSITGWRGAAPPHVKSIEFHGRE